MFCFVSLKSEKREIDTPVGPVVEESGQRGEVIPAGMLHDEERSLLYERRTDDAARYLAEVGHVIGGIGEDEVKRRTRR